MKPIIVLLNLFSLYHRHEARDNSCPQNWIQDGDSGRCYYVSDSYVSFDLAKRKCELRKSELVPVLTLEAQLQLNSILTIIRYNCEAYGNCMEFWIGVRDLNGSNTWTTTKDIPVDQKHQFWAEEHPKNDGRCVRMTFEGNKINGAWENENCRRPLKFVCITCTGDFEYFPEVNECIYFNRKMMIWDDARQVCASLRTGSQMLTIQGSTKREAIKRYLEPQLPYLEQCYNTFYVMRGLLFWSSGQTKDPKKCGTPYVWKPVGSVEIPMNYTNWFRRTPDCAEKEENCLAFATAKRYDFQWEDMVCHGTFCSFCEF